MSLCPFLSACLCPYPFLYLSRSFQVSLRWFCFSHIIIRRERERRRSFQRVIYRPGSANYQTSVCLIAQARPMSFPPPPSPLGSERRTAKRRRPPTSLLDPRLLPPHAHHPDELHPSNDPLPPLALPLSLVFPAAAAEAASAAAASESKDVSLYRGWKMFSNRRSPLAVLGRRGAEDEWPGSVTHGSPAAAAGRAFTPSPGLVIYATPIPFPVSMSIIHTPNTCSTYTQTYLHTLIHTLKASVA